MTHDEIRFHLAEDHGLRLLKSDNAPLVLGFLHEQYKKQPRVAIRHGELLERLENYVLELRAREPDVYPSAAQAYLSQWCDEKHAYLRKYFDSGSDEPVYDLTPGTERIIRWIEELGRSEFVGTESRFLQIFDLLQEIVRKSTEDPQLRLEELEKEKADLDREIAEIRATGRVERYSTTQIKERFVKANEEARRLVGDFREVESNFRQVTRRLQERRLLENATKGDVVGYVIDADEALKDSDQGRSFYAFWRFLISHAKKDELRGLLEQVYALEDLGTLEGDYSMLRNIVRHLSEAGEKVVQSNRRLAEQLRRMLEEAHLQESRRVMELIGEIKKSALALRAAPPKERDFAWVEGRPDIDLPMERPPWSAEERPSFENQPQAATPATEIDLAGLFDVLAVEREQIERQLDEILSESGQASLREVLARYPVQKGLTELLVYLVIATGDPRHVVDESETEEITVHRTDRAPKRVAMPRIIFVR